MNLLITGANGQLGSSIKKRQDNFSHHKYYFTDVDTLDITDEKSVESTIQNNNIDVLINCAAYTAVDKAEEEQDKATMLNEHAPEILARVCYKHNVRLLHVSTDYVFDGKTYIPYRENAEPNPASAYGESKRAGELKVLQSGARGAIVRTSWLYSEFGKNFTKTMLRLGAEKDELSVVCDQVGNPTYAGDLAYALMLLADKMPEKMEIYHFANEGVCSWYDMAVEIMKKKQLKCSIKPIETKDYPTPAERPPYSVFNKSKIKQFLNIAIPHWRESLNKCLNNL